MRWVILHTLITHDIWYCDIRSWWIQPDVCKYKYWFWHLTLVTFDIVNFWHCWQLTFLTSDKDLRHVINTLRYHMTFDIVTIDNLIDILTISGRSWLIWGDKVCWELTRSDDICWDLTGSQFMRHLKKN